MPNASVPWYGVWPGALGATVAIGVIDYAFPFYLSNVSSFGGLRSTLVFVLIVLIWFYVLAIIILGGAVVNELRLERRRPGTLADVPDPETEELRLEQIERERAEHRRAEQADGSRRPSSTSAAPSARATCGRSSTSGPRRRTPRRREG